MPIGLAPRRRGRSAKAGKPEGDPADALTRNLAREGEKEEMEMVYIISTASTVRVRFIDQLPSRGSVHRGCTRVDRRHARSTSPELRILSLRADPLRLHKLLYFLRSASRGSSFRAPVLQRSAPSTFRSQSSFLPVLQSPSMLADGAALRERKSPNSKFARSSSNSFVPPARARYCEINFAA